LEAQNAEFSMNDIEFSFNLMFDRLTMLEQLGLVPMSAVAA